MIHATYPLSDAIAVPKCVLPGETGVYFEPRFRVVTPDALRRDAQPVEALDQMFGYYDA